MIVVFERWFANMFVPFYLVYAGPAVVVKPVVSKHTTLAEVLQDRRQTFCPLKLIVPNVP